MCGRLDLTIEAHVSKPEFEPLFTRKESGIAQARRRECHSDPTPLLNDVPHSHLNHRRRRIKAAIVLDHWAIHIDGTRTGRDPSGFTQSP